MLHGGWQFPAPSGCQRLEESRLAGAVLADDHGDTGGQPQGFGGDPGYRRNVEIPSIRLLFTNDRDLTKDHFLMVAGQIILQFRRLYHGSF